MTRRLNKLNSQLTQVEFHPDISYLLINVIVPFEYLMVINKLKCTQ